MSPYEVQYEIFKNLGDGFAIQWDRHCPTPGVWSYIVRTKVDDGRIFDGGLRFELFLLHRMSYSWQSYVQRHARELMRAYSAATTTTRAPVARRAIINNAGDTVDATRWDYS